MATLEGLTLQATEAGRAAAIAALEGRQLPPDAVQTLSPPTELSAIHHAWPQTVEAIRLAAEAVTEMLLDEYTGPPMGRTHAIKGQEHLADFRERWSELCHTLLTPRPGTVSVPAGSALEEALSLSITASDVASELMWLVWNEIWHAANMAWAAEKVGDDHQEKLRRADDNRQHCEAHSKAVKESGFVHWCVVVPYTTCGGNGQSSRRICVGRQIGA